MRRCEAALFVVRTLRLEPLTQAGQERTFMFQLACFFFTHPHYEQIYNPALNLYTLRNPDLRPELLKIAHFAAIYPTIYTVYWMCDYSSGWLYVCLVSRVVHLICKLVLPSRDCQLRSLHCKACKAHACLCYREIGKSVCVCFLNKLFEWMFQWLINNVGQFCFIRSLAHDMQGN